MYKVVTYEIKTGLFGANTAKSDAEMEQFLKHALLQYVREEQIYLLEDNV